MAIEVAKYQFLPWVRKGIGANILQPDDPNAAGAGRAKIPIAVDVNAEALPPKDFSLLGPGDIIGINRNMVIRTEPLNNITDFEPNYLAFIEFYDEDFLWRYTPARPQGERLRPWLAVLVLKEESEFEKNDRRLPLPVIKVKEASALPPLDQSWAWAHGHTNVQMAGSDINDLEAFLLSLQKHFNDDPDQVYSRLMCPRRLDPNTAYRGFVVPAFESGRLAGLGLSPDAAPTQAPAWTAASAGVELPVYYEWFFRTGAKADFESLVTLLEPRPMPKEVGIRKMNCSAPGFGVTSSTNPLELGLEGALKSPTAVPIPPIPNAFQTKLQEKMNLPFHREADMTQDPVVSVPFYGHRHVLVNEFDAVNDAWLHELNRDPRHRVPAGFGTLVIQDHQENYMHRAWQQVGKVLEANRILRLAQLMLQIGKPFHALSFSKLPTGSLLAVSSPVLKKVMGSPVTIYHQIRQSRLPAAALSGAFRRMVRPRGKLVQRLSLDRRFDYEVLIHGLNDGTLTAAPPRPVPGMPTVADVANAIFPAGLPNWLRWALKNAGWILLLLLLLFLPVVLLTGAWASFGVLVLIAAGAYFFIQRWQQQMKAADALQSDRAMVDALKETPPRPAFRLQLDATTTPPATAPPPPLTASGDSLHAANFRRAAQDFHTLLAAMPRLERTIEPISLSVVQAKVSRAIHPEVAYARQVSAFVTLPIPDFSFFVPENIAPVMEYPHFDDAMYEKLRDTPNGEELLIPNIHLIPPNTISLLRTNQKFIESYMVGLNHEMARELLWREYPTDQRGSYFRQFWEVKGIISPQASGDTAADAERLKDIDPIHTWGKSTFLGRHNKREAQGDAEQLVLLIRGDLLKRYPNTIVYAQKAHPATADDKKRFPGIEKVVKIELTTDDFKKELKFPLYRAEVPPDIKFFGFDLTVEQAKGVEDTEGFEGDRDGWFFVIQEVPGEPRFGMDISRPKNPQSSWDDLSWEHFNPPVQTHLKSDQPPNIATGTDHPGKWGSHAAEMAYILFQKPVMVAVHADEMLEKLTN
jgi:hypothetical protein